MRFMAAGLAVLLIGSVCACGGASTESRLLLAALDTLSTELDHQFSVDPTVLLADSGMVDATAAERGVLSDVLRQAGLPEGDARFAKTCADFRTSLGVPSVLESDPTPPEGCDLVEVPVFALGYSEEEGVLRVRATGWSWDRSLGYQAEVSRADGGRVNILRLTSMENL